MLMTLSNAMIVCRRGTTSAFWWNNPDKGKTKTLGGKKTCPSLSTTNATQIGVGLNPRPDHRE
jgi:hypothetical protein